MLKLIDNFLIDRPEIIGYQIQNNFVFKKNIEIYLCTDSNKHFIYLKSPRKYSGVTWMYRGYEERYYIELENVLFPMNSILEITDKNFDSWMINDKVKADTIAFLNYKKDHP